MKLRSLPIREGTWSALVLCWMASAVTASTFAAPIPVQHVQKDAHSLTLTMSPGIMRLTICSEDTVRVMYSPAATLPVGQDFAVTNHFGRAVPFKVAEAEGKVTVTTRKLKVAVDKASGAVAFFDAAGKLLLAEPADGGKTMPPATVNGESSFQPEQTFISPQDEFIFGLGQFQEGIWNWRGLPQQLRQLNTEISLPMIVSSYGYGLLWNNASLTDFNPAETQITLTNKTGTFTTTDAGDYVFFVKDGDRRGLIGVQINGETIRAITNMWVTYNLSARTTLAANTTVSVEGPRRRQECQNLCGFAGQHNDVPLRGWRRD